MKIKLTVRNKKWVFFANGIGPSLESAVEKAFLESIQYVPGSDEGTWEDMMAASASRVHRLKEWKNCPLVVSEGSFQRNQKDIAPEYLEEVLLRIGGKVEVSSIQDCPNVFLGSAKIDSRKNWNSYTGVPIS